MISYPPALRGSGFVAPRAVGRLGAAIAEARAAEARPAAEVPTPVVRAPPPRRTVVRLWLPLTILFLLLAPFALLLAPLLYLAPRRYRLRPFATVAGLGQVLLSLGGTVVLVDTPDALVRIRIY